MRKLLPYEHQLIEALDITEEEYWQFCLTRDKYADVKVGTIYDIRNEVAGTIALVLSIVGTIAQVAAALLAPRPDVPSAANARRSRNTAFAPRYGFNSFQEVARYGDPVNLVYTNIDENEYGGLRVNTSLVWSAVQSFGSSQFIQMMTVVGAGEIERIGFRRTAFGQASIADFATQRLWLYYKGAGGALVFNDLQIGELGGDPSYDGQGGGSYAYMVKTSANGVEQGYSQAFSPSTNTTLGLYDVIPINVKVLERDEKGQIRKDDKDDLGIYIPAEDRGVYWPNDWVVVIGPRPLFPKDQELRLIFKEDEYSVDTDAEEAALNMRNALISGLNSSALYKIGAAKFQLVNAQGAEAVPTGRKRRRYRTSQGVFTFKCVEAGVLCEEDYDIKNYLKKEDDLEEDLAIRKAQLTALEEERSYFGNEYTGVGADLIIAKEAELAEYDALIEEATGILDGDINSDDINNIIARAEAEGKFTNITNAISAIDETIKNLQSEKAQLDNAIDDIQNDIDEILAERPFSDGERERFRAKKATKKQYKDRRLAIPSEIKAAKLERKKLYGRLSTKALKYGLYDGKNKTNLREERRRLKRLRRRVENETALLASQVPKDEAAMAARNANWQQRYNSVLAEIQDIENDLRDRESFDDHFNVKCLAKIDEISYTTLTNCDIVNLSLKSKIFKRIAGRQSKYAENKEQSHKDSDNGLKIRTAMFWVLYKEAYDLDAPYKRVPVVFAIRKGVETDNYTDVRFVFNKKTKWSFKFEPIVDLSAELRTHQNGQETGMAYLRTRSYKNSQSNASVNLVNGDGAIHYHGSNLLYTEDLLPARNNNPGFVDEWGVFSVRSDTQIAFSFDNGPEISLIAVTEQQRQTLTPQVYENMSLLGFNAYSGKGIQDLRSLSAFVSKGKKVRRLNYDGSYEAIPSSSTSYAPEIFLDTVLDEVNGIGAYSNINGIDLQKLGEAKKFCAANGYFMDGVIAEPESWREFWATVAPYSLLEFIKIGGKEALYPALPFDTYGKITRQITISALFNQGNILEGSYKEEFIDYGDNTEDLLATIVYRDRESDNSFPGNTSVQVRLADANEASCIRQTFDLSNYVSRRSQAINYGMLLCQQRRHSKRAVEFKTFPTESPVQPGSYIYVQTDQNEWDNLRTGKVEQGGIINFPIAEPIQSGNFDALLYKGSTGVVKLSDITINNNQSNRLINYADYLIVLGTAITSKRVFRVSEVAMEEEGEVSIKAMEHPCSEEDGKTISRIVRFDERLFQID